MRERRFAGILPGMARLAFVLFVMSGLVAGCGASQTSCLQGETCVCSSSQPCALLCPMGGCEADCVDSESCYVDCPGGGCTVTGSSEGLTHVVCTAGGCSLTCGSAAQCAITSCMEDCSVTCGGSNDCQNACTDPTCVTQ